MKRLITILLSLCVLSTGAVLAQDKDAETPYTPFLISFVPMVSMPLGYYDVSFSAAAVGGLVRDSNGLMGAGVFNIARDLKGLQAAGVFNTARDVSGGQAAGVFNTADTVKGSQVSWVFNVAGDLRGIQAAGVFNRAKDVRGLQLAYTANFAEDLRGAQLSYVINSARHVRGVQFGLVNIATEIDGVQIGLVNIARDGVGGLGVTYEPQTRNFQAYWQNGTRFLYTVAAAAIPEADNFSTFDNMVAGFGLGTRIGGRHLSPYVDLEALAMVGVRPSYEKLEAIPVNKDSCLGDYFSPWPQLRIRLGLPLGHLVQLVGGYTIDFDFARLPNLPAAYKTGSSWSDTLFGESYSAYGRWFLGLKI